MKRRLRMGTFDLDVKDIVRQCADQFLNGECDNYTLEEFCLLTQQNVRLPGIKDWVRREITHRSKEIRI